MYLALGDTASALRVTRAYLDSMPPERSTLTNEADEWSYLAVPRMLRQRGDLAAATGSVEEARAAYVRLLDLWKGADAELQPEVERVRAALAALRSR